MPCHGLHLRCGPRLLPNLVCFPGSSGRLYSISGLRNRFTKLKQRLDMSRDRLADIQFVFFQGPAGADTAWQVGNVCRPIGFCSLENQSVFSVHYFASKPAALRIDFKVPMGRWPVAASHPIRSVESLLESLQENSILGTQGRALIRSSLPFDLIL